MVSIGIGINTGSVVFGSVSAKDRMDFTSIGDTVNLAARLEGANKIYGTKTLITEAVHDRVTEAYLRSSSNFSRTARLGSPPLAISRTNALPTTTACTSGVRASTCSRVETPNPPSIFTVLPGESDATRDRKATPAVSMAVRVPVVPVRSVA